MEEYTVQDAARLLHVSEKTVYRWIETGKLKARKYGIQHFILKSSVERVVLSRPVQPSAEETGLEALQQRLDTIEQRINDLSTLFDVQDLRISELEEKLQRLEQTQEPPQPVTPEREVRQPPHTPAASQAVKSTIPVGYALVRHFNTIHGLKDTTVSRRINEGILSVTRGEWQHGSTVVRQVLSPEQQALYYRMLHTSPGFTQCKDCPHAQE